MTSLSVSLVCKPLQNSTTAECPKFLWKLDKQGEKRGTDVVEDEGQAENLQ